MRMTRLLLVLLVLGGFLASATVSILAGAAEQLLMGDPPHVSQCAGMSSCELVYAATTLEYHLNGVNENDYPHNADDTPTDPFLRPIWDYWKQVCGGSVCSDMVPGNVQCVEFVKGVFFLAHQPVNDHPDAIDWWYDYANKPGWKEIPADSAPPDQRGVPQPGDVVIWDDGGAGHIAIVIGVQLPLSDKDGWVEVAQGNGPGNRFPGSDWPGNYYTMTLKPDLSVLTWPGYRVMGYIRETPPQSPMPSNLAESPYAATAENDASAVGIPPAYYAEQIQVESGYNPKALSPAGAEGIAQFMPDVAAGQGIDPWNPVQSLQMASLLMMGYNTRYGGDYAAALAGYNGGEAAVDRCKLGHDPAWLNCLGHDVQAYVLNILYYPTGPLPGSVAARVQPIIQADNNGEYDSTAQHDTWWDSVCSAAAFTEVARAWGISDVRIGLVLDRLLAHNPPYITVSGGLMSADGWPWMAEAYQLQAQVAWNAFTFDSLVEQVNRTGIPIIIGMQAASWGHYVVVVGGDSAQAEIVDSSLWRMHFLPRSFFSGPTSGIINEPIWWSGETITLTPM